MRRLARLLLATCATATLLLFLATVALHARSRATADYLWHNGERHTVGVFSSGGLAQVTVRTWDNPAPLGPGRPRWELYPSRPVRSLPAMLASLLSRHHVGVRNGPCESKAGSRRDEHVSTAKHLGRTRLPPEQVPTAFTGARQYWGGTRLS